MGIYAMSEIALKTAIARREKLLREIEKLDAFIELYHELTEETHGGSAPDLLATAPDGSKIAVQVKSYQRDVPRIKPRNLPPVVREILVANGRPMTRTQIIEALKGKGITMPAQDEARYLGTILWRFRNDFINIDGEGYWPRDVSCDAVAYDARDLKNVVSTDHFPPNDL
jgi:hypothetical protein